MFEAKRELLHALGAAAERLQADLPAEQRIAPQFEAPKQAAHGDFACTVAMPLAKPLKQPPRAVAEALVAQLRAMPAARWLDKVEIAGPGFINLTLSAAARQAVVASVLHAGDRYGHQPPTGERVMVEFVSANPTGPLHVGHGRNAALGDSLCRLLQTQGQNVYREFYYNDAGVQIATLTQSVAARIAGLKPGDEGWPADAYNGEYIADIARDFMAGATVASDDRQVTASANPQDHTNLREFAVAYLRHEQDLDLAAFDVRFDHHYLESSLYTDGRVEDAVARLVAAGQTYEKDGALWLATTAYGDDKDRVMRKSDGSYTYFVPDVAYHIAKWQRGFAKVVNVQGTDHHGTIARVRAGLQAAAVGIPQGYPDYALYKMITVMRGGEEVKISKRAGSYVTLRDLIEWTSRDAVRFFLVSRKSDTEFVFDIDLALQQGDENPVFYVQYAHARICSVLDSFVAEGGSMAALATAELAPLVAPTETALLRLLAEFPGVVTQATRDLAPHDVAFYARALSAAFHSWYAAERFLVDDPGLRGARMALLAAVRQTLRNALWVLGVSAPQRLQREAAEPAAKPSATSVTH
jgi:arginyl-tRNA synthetase